MPTSGAGPTQTTPTTLTTEDKQGLETQSSKVHEVTTPPSKKHDSKEIPSQVQIQDQSGSVGRVPISPTPSSPPTTSLTDSQMETTKVAMPPPSRQEGVIKSETPPPSGGSQLGGVFSRLKKRVVESAWQGGGGEAKVRGRHG